MSRCGDSSQNALPFDVSIAFFTKAIRTRRIKSTTSLAANMAANRMLTTLPILAFDAMHGRGAMSVRLTLKAATALAAYRRHFPQPGSNLLWTPLSAAMTNACLIGRFADCEHYAREGLQTLGPKPSPQDSRLISAQGHLGWALAYLGRPAEAKPLLSQAIATYNQQKRRPFAMSQLESALDTLGGR